MPTIQQVLLEMEEYMLPWREKRDALGQLRRQSYTSEQAYERRRVALAKEVSDLEREMESLLRLFEREPDRLFLRHSTNLPTFNQDGSGNYDDFVFIMTK